MPNIVCSNGTACVPDDSILNEIQRAAVQSFMECSNTNYYSYSRLGLDMIDPIVNKYRNFTDQDLLDQCLMEASSCQESLKEIWISLVSFFDLHERSVSSAGFGHLMSYFAGIAGSWLVTSRESFLTSSYVSLQQKEIETFLRSIIDELSGRQLNISAYEFAKVTYRILHQIAV